MSCNEFFFYIYNILLLVWMEDNYREYIIHVFYSTNWLKFDLFYI